MVNLAAMKGGAPCATTVSCDLEVLQEIRELQVESSWNVMAHGDAGRGSEGETAQWSG